MVLAIIILMICSIVANVILRGLMTSALEGLEGGRFGTLCHQAEAILPSVHPSLYR